jgi:hypothetical protein
MKEFFKAIAIATLETVIIVLVKEIGKKIGEEK